MKIILASQSPRRKAILHELNLIFDVIVPNCDEITSEVEPEKIVMDLAKQKAQNVKDQIDAQNDKKFSQQTDTQNDNTISLQTTLCAKEKPNAIIIAADTIVYLNDKILGKPKTQDEAFGMLTGLQNNWHTVYTGVALIRPNGKIVNYHEKAEVHMRPLSDDEIWAYINTGDAMDKAGAYGIQDKTCNFVDEVKGELETVIGLPVLRLKEELL